VLIPVILSGGSGTRLWPQSRAKYPKQFIALNANQTLLQQTVTRLEGIPELDNPIIVANMDHRFVVAEQLRFIGEDKATIILEPFAKNTAPAITIAALNAMKKHQDPLLLVLAADHLIQHKDSFHRAILCAKEVASINHLVTFGIVPTQPEVGYGYIKCTSSKASLDKKGYAKVEKFVEKPNHTTAEEYVKAGNYYWNSGMFLFKASVFLQEMEMYQPTMLQACHSALAKARQDLTFIRLDENSFAMAPNNSIDYAVIEKTDKAVMVPLDAGWSDIGSWAALWEMQPKTKEGNVIKGDVIALDTKNSYIRSEHKLIATLGVNNLIVAESDDAIIIADKDESQHIKRIVEVLRQHHREEASSHRKKYQPWGHADLLDAGARFKVNHVTVKPGEKLSLHKHYHHTEHWVVVQGTAKVERDGDTLLLSENQSIYIEPGILHRLENSGKIDLKVVEVQSGEYLHEDDIERFDDIYGRDCISKSDK